MTEPPIALMLLALGLLQATPPPPLTKEERETLRRAEDAEAARRRKVAEEWRVGRPAREEAERVLLEAWEAGRPARDAAKMSRLKIEARRALQEKARKEEVWKAQEAAAHRVQAAAKIERRNKQIALRRARKAKRKP